MKAVYPIILTPDDPGYVVYVPDFDILTQGYSLEEALLMAKDAIGLAGITLEDEGKEIPKPKTLKPACKENELTALVDVDFAHYRQKDENRMVRKNCTIPLWLDKEATAKHVNFSAVLQEGLKQIVG